MSFPEQDRAVQILEKEFGPRWKQIVQELGTKELRQRVGKELTSFMAFPERGSGGNNKWRGNCSPEVVRAILRYVLECKHYYGKQTQDFIPGDLRAISKHIHEPVQFPVALQHFCHV